MKKEIRIPRKALDLENEAEIIGIILGDGYINKKEYSIRLKVRENDFINNFANLIKKTYGIGTRYKYYDYPCCYVHSINLASRINKLTNKKQRIPNFIICGSKNIKARFLRGFFDSEGSVDVLEKYHRRQIVLTQKNIPWLKQIKTMLFDIGIQSKIYKKPKDSDKLVISLIENMEKYYNLVGFSIRYKQNKLKLAIDYLKNHKPHEKEKYWSVLRHWLKSKKSLRASAKEVKIHWETYRSWIYGTKVPCQIKKDLEFNILPSDHKDLIEQYSFLSNLRNNRDK
ncbi:MAG: LAGLIDADG family homing endonuclease [Nanoarchaeota archaeon]